MKSYGFFSPLKLHCIYPQNVANKVTVESLLASSLIHVGQLALSLCETKICKGYLYLLRCCEWRSHIMPAVIISTFEKDGPRKNNPRKKGVRVFCQIDGSSFYQHEDLMRRLGTQTHSYRQDNRETGKGWGQRDGSECRLWTTGTGEVSWTFSWTTCLSLCLVSVTTEKLSWPVHGRATSLGADTMHL